MLGRTPDLMLTACLSVLMTTRRHGRSEHPAAEAGQAGQSTAAPEPGHGCAVFPASVTYFDIQQSP